MGAEWEQVLIHESTCDFDFVGICKRSPEKGSKGTTSFAFEKDFRHNTANQIGSG